MTVVNDDTNAYRKLTRQDNWFMKDEVKYRRSCKHTKLRLEMRHIFTERLA